MTGFGKVTAELPDKKVTVEIKSLNSKQLDLSVRIPAAYRDREMLLRNELLQRLERGKVDLNINVEYIGRDTSEQIHELAGRLGVPEPTDWFATLLRLPETVRSEAGEVSEAEWQAVHGAVSEAVTRLIDFRTQEGAMLRRVFEQKIGIIGDLLREVDPYEQERVEKIRSRLTENLKKISEVEYDRNRLEQELSYYLEKLDINEEKDRLANHLNYFLRTLDSEHGQGKKLGFIAQEIGREINTLGSKSNHAEMQIIVVRMKDVLEQIKEQILNVL